MFKKRCLLTVFQFFSLCNYHPQLCLLFCHAEWNNNKATKIHSKLWKKLKESHTCIYRVKRVACLKYCLDDCSIPCRVLRLWTAMSRSILSTHQSSEWGSSWKFGSVFLLKFNMWNWVWRFFFPMYWHTIWKLTRRDFLSLQIILLRLAI